MYLFYTNKFHNFCCHMMFSHVAKKMKTFFCCNNLFHLNSDLTASILKLSGLKYFSNTQIEKNNQNYLSKS